LTGKRILVVEDEFIVAWDLQNILRRIGHVPIGCATSGEEAIRMAAETLPDLVLMDVQLDGEIDGVAASMEITRVRPVPIVYLTAYSESFLKGPSTMVHPYLCIAKPFSAATIQTAIESIIGVPQVRPN